MNELPSTSITSKPLFIVMMFSASWALQIFITKLGFNVGAQVLAFQSVSLLAAFLVLVIVFVPQYGRKLYDLLRTRPRLYWQLFLANSIQSGLGTWLSIIGISLTAAINAGFLVKLSTVSTVILAWIFLKERLSFVKVVMVIMMIFGAYLLTTKGEVLLPRVGDLFILGACVCWSVGNVMLRRSLQTQPIEIELITLQKPFAALPVVLLLAGVVLCFPNSRIGEILISPGVQVPLTSHLFAISNGIILVLVWNLLNLTLKLTTASYMTMMSMATPIFVSLLAYLFLHESIAGIQAAGAGLIIMAGVITFFSDIASV